MSNTENNPVFHYTLHQRLWNHLADNPGMNKEHAINNFFTKEEKEAFDSNGCAACTYAGFTVISSRMITDCDNCPLDTSNVQVDEFMGYVYRRYTTDCLKKLYGTWLVITYAIIAKKYPDYALTTHIRDSNGKEYSEEELKELCSKYAKMIANLPVKEGIPFD